MERFYERWYGIAVLSIRSFQEWTNVKTREVSDLRMSKCRNLRNFGGMGIS